MALNQPLTVFRFRNRYVHQTIYTALTAALQQAGWPTDPSLPVNFDTTPFTYIDVQPDDAGKDIAVNTVAITLGEQPTTQDQELGGGYRLLSFALFVDIYGETQAITQAIASDAVDLLADTFIPLLDWSQAPPVPNGDTIQIWHDEISIERPAAAAAPDFKRFWRVVKAIARVYYVPEDLS